MSPFLHIGRVCADHSANPAYLPICASGSRASTLHYVYVVSSIWDQSDTVAATTVYSPQHPYLEPQEIPHSAQLPSVEDAAEHYQTVITTRMKIHLPYHYMIQLSSPRYCLSMLDVNGWGTLRISPGPYPLEMGGNTLKRLEPSTSWYCGCKR